MYKTLIDCDGLRAALGRTDWVIVDCRFDLADPAAGRRAYEQSHLPGALYAHLDEELSAPRTPESGRHPLPSPARLCSLFGQWGIDSDKQVVAYDNAGGTIAARLWWLLRYMGHEAVAVLDGGWAAWTAAGLPVTAEVRTPTPTVFTGAPRRDRVVETDAVATVARLIDSRDPVRYRGESEPLDPVAGHIPGALNYFCRNNLDADGKFRSRGDLRTSFAPLFSGVAPEDVAFYCGSGVTACHNILAALHAGYAEPRLYAGSWSEWCADPRRPVATGDLA